MAQNPLCVSKLMLAAGGGAACVIASAWANTAPPSSMGAAVVPMTAAAPVYEASDSLAFRALVVQPTEHVDRPFLERLAPKRRVHVKLLSFNDFHGQLSTTRVLEGRRLGGAAVLASYLRAHTRGFEGRSVIAHAGDFVGASPAESALFQDEPTIAFFNQLSNGQCDRQGNNPRCNLVGLLGNHEFDEGVDELMRMVRGGNHVNGPFLGRTYRGEQYPTVCANVVDARTGRALLPPLVVKELAGVKVGFVGAVYDGATWFLKKSGVASVKFQNEVQSINRGVNALKARGVHAIVVLIHQGGRQRFSQDLPRDITAVSGEIPELVAKFDAEVDVVIAGHSHTVLSALVPNAGGRATLLTQAFHSGSAFADIDLDIDADSGRIVSKRASIVSTFADAGPGLTPDAAVLAIVQAAERAAEKRTSQVVGRARTAIPAEANGDGESPLGDLIADAQRAALRVDFAFTTPSWVRAGIDAGPVTWGDLFEVQPFGNRLQRVALRGKEVIALLNQQWSIESYSRILHVSGLTYTWDARRPRNLRVVEVTVHGKPIELEKKYFAAINEFLAEGGEGFSVLEAATRRASAQLDIDALVSVFKAAPEVSAQLDGRIRRIDPQVSP